MRGAEAFAALTAAMEHTRPLCKGDDRFISDELTAADAIELTETCTLCPLRAACDAYAIEGRPAGGFYAGRMRGTK